MRAGRGGRLWDGAQGRHRQFAGVGVVAGALAVASQARSWQRQAESTSWVAANPAELVSAGAINKMGRESWKGQTRQLPRLTKHLLGLANAADQAAAHGQSLCIGPPRRHGMRKSQQQERAQAKPGQAAILGSRWVLRARRALLLGSSDAAGHPTCRVLLLALAQPARHSQCCPCQTVRSCCSLKTSATAGQASPASPRPAGHGQHTQSLLKPAPPHPARQGAGTHWQPG